ncbi:MAG: MlaD family protein [Legionella sp.]|nr:MlaD family protein [Legionella sp.]
MEAKTNYTMVGLIVIILMSALLATALWLSVGFDQKKYQIYAVYMHEAVSGLSEESVVKYNGVQVGTVSKIELSRVDPQEVKLLLKIVEGTPVTTSTTATLISQGITGNTYVGLSATSSDLTPLKKIPKEPYPIIPSRPSLFNQLDRVLKEVSENVNNVSIRLKDIFDNENAANLKKSLNNLQSFTKVLAEHNANISRSLKNSDVLLHNMADASKDLPEIIAELKNSINKLTKEISSAGQSVTKTMDAGKTAIDKISDQTIPPAILLLRKLNNIAANLEKVSVQMRQNPSVVIRGTAPPPSGPGE